LMGGRSSVVLAEGNFHDKYALGRKLGQGTFGQVRACNLRDGGRDKFVVKIMDVRLHQDEDDGDLSQTQSCLIDAEKLSDVRNECLMMRRAGHSMYCVSLIEVFVAQGMQYLVMQRCECSLLDKLEEMRQWNHLEMRHIFREMLLGIEHMHNQSIVHRDIKPDNFLYGLDRVVKLADFGLALVMPKPKSPFCGVRAPPGIEGIVGTAPYMSPEMLLGDKYDHRTDSWSYGVSVYFMVYGEFPYGAHAKTRSSMKSAIATGVPKPPYKPDEKVICKDADGSMIQQMAKGYLECLLDRSPKTRWSSKQALGAQFFSERAQLLWSSSDTTSSIDLQLMVETARTITREFDDKNNLDVTIETGLDVLLSKLQQQHGASSSELRRAFSLPVPAKAKPGTHLEPLTEEDELFTEILTRVSSCSSVNTVRRAITHDGAASMSSEAAFAMQAAVNELDDMPSESGALKGDWSEETWSDESTGDLPPPLPRLPPCHAAVAAVCGR